MGETYRINEIAKLYGLCADTLRYYEEQGVVTPLRGENRYRLYTVQDLCDLNIVQNLRSLDVPIARIRKYMAERTTDRTLELLAEEERIIARRIAELEALRRSADKRAAEIRAAQKMPVGEFSLVELPDRPCYRLSEGVTLEGDLDFLLKKLEVRHPDRLRLLGNRQMGATLDTRGLEQSVYSRYSQVFFLCDREDCDERIPAGTYASTVYANTRIWNPR